MDGEGTGFLMAARFLRMGMDITLCPCQSNFWDRISLQLDIPRSLWARGLEAHCFKIYT